MNKIKNVSLCVLPLFDFLTFENINVNRQNILHSIPDSPIHTQIQYSINNDDTTCSL